MPNIGLTSDQMFTVFVQATMKRLQSATADLEAAAAGESPDKAKLIETIQSQYPSIPYPFWEAVHALFGALFDTVEANNQVLARSVPHVEP